MQTFDELKAKYKEMGFPDFQAGNLAREELEGPRTIPWMNDGAPPKKSKRTRGEGGVTIRSIIEPGFLANGRCVSVDALEMDERYGIVITPQNIKSALKTHIMKGERLSVTRDAVDGNILVAKIVADEAVTKERAGGKPGQKVINDRERICLVVNKLLADNAPIRDALNMIIRSGGVV